MSKASGGDGIPVALFQILKDDAVKMLHSICQQIWKTQQWPQDWKRSVFIPIRNKGNAKKCSIDSSQHASKVMIKILQAKHPRSVNLYLLDSQVDLVVKNSPANPGDIRDVELIPVSGRSLGRGHDNRLQYSCLRIPWTEEPGGIAKSQT